ncbi:hypothetical protein TNCV_604311 [Trichonephila clavipes]|nr:hypothetical protein TNCV_604311 [Trichonephila clavipes]
MSRCPDQVVSLKRDPQCFNLRASLILIYRPTAAWAGGKENILQSPAPVVSAVASLKTFGPTVLMSTYSVCPPEVFVGIGHRAQAIRSGI